TIKGKAPEFIRLMPIQFYAASSPEGKSVMRMGSIKAKVFASVFGAHLSNSIDDIWLRRGFGVLLLIMGLRELFSKKK
ncbi:MAG: hypothetical protein II233_00550, partial [Clostridia bacterium]|nr:hypothetical protein [Clostridia bacterium]